MTGYFKWIGAGVGFYLSRYSLFGAFIGFLFGSFIDNFQRAAKYMNEKGANQGGFSSAHNFYKHYQQQSTAYDFQTILIILSAAVMKADNKVLKSELNFVKKFLNQQFGQNFSQENLQELKAYINRDQLPLREVCTEIRLRAQTTMRIQIMHYLFGIAQADGSVSPQEMRVLRQLASLLDVPPVNFSNFENKYHRDTASDFQLLGLPKNASDQEIKKAYRKLALRYHPDKVAQLGKEEQEKAKEKFQQIQSAYEAIKKERGF